VFLGERGLELSQEKTLVTHVETGFDFLGQNVRKYDDGKLLLRPSKKSVRAVLAKAREIIRTHRTAPAGALIERLNPIIRGWAYYHRHGCSKRILKSVDHVIFKWLWQWATRRHPDKGRRWVQAKYYARQGTRGWRFTGTVTTEDLHRRPVYLWESAYLPIRRHVKIRSEANPFDPAWEGYFEARLSAQMATDPRLRRELIGLWKEQRGICPVCSERITAQTGWHRHHIVWRSLGGPDVPANYILLHPTCHQQLHRRGLTVQKPRSLTGALKRLEPDEGKLSRPVLRGGRDGDATPLPDYAPAARAATGFTLR
jgi:RNA-directed DNA polymerase